MPRYYSIAGRNREMLEEAMTQQANARSIRDEMIQAQNVAKELEGWVTELRAEKQHVIKELSRMKEERDANLEKLQKEVAELKENEPLTKESAVEEYKPSNDFQEVVAKTTSTYFSEGFELCKKHIGLFHPNLDIQDLQINLEMADEEEDEENGDLVNNPSPQQASQCNFFFGEINVILTLIRCTLFLHIVSSSYFSL